MECRSKEAKHGKCYPILTQRLSDKTLKKKKEVNLMS